MSLGYQNNTTVDCIALTNSGYWTMHTCYACIVIHQAIAMQSQLCAPFIDRSHAASICASLRGCWILLWCLALRPDSRSAAHHNRLSTVTLQWVIATSTMLMRLCAPYSRSNARMSFACSHFNRRLFRLRHLGPDD